MTSNVTTLDELFELTSQALDFEFDLEGSDPETIGRAVEASVIRLAKHLAENTDYMRARTLLLKGLSRFPDSYDIFVCLGEVELDESFLDEALGYFQRAEAINTQDANLYKFLAATYERLGRYADADIAWRTGFPDGTFVVENETPQAGLPRLLVIMTPLWGNIRFRQFTQQSDFLITRCFAESYTADSSLPECDLVFLAIGDPSMCTRALGKAQRMIERLQKPYINDAECVLHTGREEIAKRLQGLPNVIVPRTDRLSMEVLRFDSALASLSKQGFHLPFLLRLPGYHSGQKFEKVNTPQDFTNCIATFPDGDCLVLQYMDARGADASFRKYRVMSIDGKLYPLHLAISHDWKVHYFTSDMVATDIFRREEQRFLENMHDVLGEKAIAALRSIFIELGLEYAGIDFALDDSGNVLVFEANAGMAIVEAAEGEQWDYRRPAIACVIDAAKNMLLKRVRQC